MSPYLPIQDAAALGQACRAARYRVDMALAEAAMVAGVNYRFASELENGKPTARLETVLRYAAALGVEIFCTLPEIDPPAEEAAEALDRAGRG